MAKITAGFVYAFSNESMPGILKVGMSQRVPDLRAKDDDLNSTGVPTAYKVEYYAFFPDAFLAERTAHQRLSDWHVNKEYFRLPLDHAVSVIESIDDCQPLFTNLPDQSKGEQSETLASYLINPRRFYEQRSIRSQGVRAHSASPQSPVEPKVKENYVHPPSLTNQESRPSRAEIDAERQKIRERKQKRKVEQNKRVMCKIREIMADQTLKD